MSIGSWLRRLVGARHEQEAPVVDRRHQVLDCELLDPDEKVRVYPTLGSLLHAHADFEPGYVPAALLAQKAKVVTDGIVAALELAGLDAARDPAGTQAFLSGIHQALGNAAVSPQATAEVQKLLDAAAEPARLAMGLDDGFTYVPLGFYTWNPSLTDVFRRDRLLQRHRLTPSLAEALVRCFLSSPALRQCYSQHLLRAARLTSRLSYKFLDLRPRMTAQEERREYTVPSHPLVGDTPEVVFPPSWAPENEFHSTSRFFAAVRAGDVSLAPSPSDGFYIHQLFSLEPLICPQRGPESSRRLIDPAYAKELEALGLGILAMSRETHVKQLELAAPAAAAMQVAKRWISPGLSLEPHPTYYQRTADSFAFLRSVVAEGWGESALGWKQWRSQGESAASIEDGIRDLIALAEAAAAVSSAELQMTNEAPESLSTKKRLLAKLSGDVDLNVDLRGMVPLAREPGDRFRVLVNLGWELRRLRVSFAIPPEVSGPDVAFQGEIHLLPVPVIREWLVPRLSSPSELQAIADRADGALEMIVEYLHAEP